MKQLLFNQMWELNLYSEELYKEKWLSYGKINKGKVKGIQYVIANKGIQKKREKIDKSKWNQFNLYEDKI